MFFLQGTLQLQMPQEPLSLNHSIPILQIIGIGNITKSFDQATESSPDTCASFVTQQSSSDFKGLSVYVQYDEDRCKKGIPVVWIIVCICIVVIVAVIITVLLLLFGPRRPMWLKYLRQSEQSSVEDFDLGGGFTAQSTNITYVRMEDERINPMYGKD